MSVLLVEKVARAICVADGDDPDRLWNAETPEPRWKIYLIEANAAITTVLDAIAEPNNAMRIEGRRVLASQDQLTDEACAVEAYRAMIAALRAEVKSERDQ